jgi:LacI family transcriptional regulator
VRSLRRGRTHIISFYNAFRNRGATDLYMEKLSTAIEYSGGRFGYDILVHCNFTREPNEIYQFLNGRLADGVLIFAPTPDDPLLALLRRSNLPVVLINQQDPAHMMPSVVDGNEIGMRFVAETLYDLGHRRIAALTSDGPYVRDAKPRIDLLRKFLAERGLAIPDERILNCHPFRPEQVAALLSGPDRPTALFCWHDRLAYQALEACEEYGIKVPQQVSIVGYDGLRWPSATPHVAGSVKVDLDLLASRSVMLLDQYIQGYEGPLIEETLPVSLSPGTTLGPAPKR